MRDSRKNFSLRRYAKPFPKKFEAKLRKSRKNFDSKLKEAKKDFKNASSKDKAKMLAKTSVAAATGAAGAAILYKSSKLYRTKGYHALRNAYIETARRAVNVPFKISAGIQRTADEILEVGQKNFAKAVATRIRNVGRGLLDRAKIRASNYVNKNINRIERFLIRAGKFIDKTQKKILRREWTQADDQFWANVGTARYARQSIIQNQNSRIRPTFSDSDAAKAGLREVKEVVGGVGEGNTISPNIRVRRYMKYGLENNLRRILKKQNSGIPLTRREQQFMNEVNVVLGRGSGNRDQYKKASEIRKLIEKITSELY